MSNQLDLSAVFGSSPLVKELGGHLSLDSMPSGIKDLMPAFYHRANDFLAAMNSGSNAWQAPLRPYHFEYVASREINAVAFLDEVASFIGLNYGTWFSLIYLPSALFGLPDFLPGIGDSEAERQQDHESLLYAIAEHCCSRQAHRRAKTAISNAELSRT